MRSDGQWTVSWWTRYLVVGLLLANLLAPAPARPAVAAPIVTIEIPSADAEVSDQVRVAGWAADPDTTASMGTGITEITVWLGADGPAGGQRLGVARRGVPRTDIAETFANPRFTLAGWEFVWDTAGLATEPTPMTLAVVAETAQLSATATVTVLVQPSDKPVTAPTAPARPPTGIRPTDATLALGTLGTATGVTVEGVALFTYSSANGVFYFPDTVPVGRVFAAVEGVELMATRVTEVMGLPRLDKPITFFLSPSQAAMQTQIRQIQGGAEASSFAEGVSFGPGAKYQGIFFNVANGDDPGLLTHLIAHEYVHQVVNVVTRNRRVEAWFNEGLANHAAQAALRARYRAQMDTRQAGWLVSVAGGVQMNNLVGFAELETNTNWQRIGGRSRVSVNLIYAQSTLAVEALAKRHGLTNVAGVLKSVGDGQPFKDAFQTMAGRSVGAFEADFFAEVKRQYPIAVPTVGPVGGEFNGIFASFRPNERVTGRVIGPNNSRQGAYSAVANDQGALWVRFVVPENSSTGTWAIEATGEQSGVTKVEFRVE